MFTYLSRRAVGLELQPGKSRVEELQQAQTGFGDYPTQALTLATNFHRSTKAFFTAVAGSWRFTTVCFWLTASSVAG